MPLFLRALPLSIGTLWHYVFLFPLVLAVSLPFLLLTIIPFAGLPVTWGVITFIGFAGYRCALAAHGHGNEPSFSKLVVSSLTMGVLVALCSLFFLAVSVAIGTGLGLLGVGENITVSVGFDIPMVAGLSLVIYLVVNSLFYFAMSVPMTAAAHAATPKGRDSDPFFGFGSGLFSLITAWGLWMVGMVYFGFFDEIGRAIAYGTYLAMGNIVGFEGDPPMALNVPLLVLSVLFMLWGTCWFSATAVLAWDRRHARVRAEKEVVAAVPRVSADDLRALREARMPGKQDGF